MNKTIAEAVSFIDAVDSHVHDTAIYGIATSFIALQDSVKHANNLIVAAENCHYEDHGAFTGEVSVPMLQEIGVTHCIIGHSERRMMFGDTNETVSKKAKKLIDANIVPIVCVGESEAEYDANQSEAVIRSQIQGSLATLCKECVKKIVIAYEPIWAIGTGKSASKEVAQNCCAIVRDEVKNLFGAEAAEAVRIQYGGSVKPENIKEYMAEADIDGALIGGASLKPDSFIEIIENSKA